MTALEPPLNLALNLFSSLFATVRTFLMAATKSYFTRPSNG